MAGSCPRIAAAVVTGTPCWAISEAHVWRNVYGVTHSGSPACAAAASSRRRKLRRPIGPPIELANTNVSGPAGRVTSSRSSSSATKRGSGTTLALCVLPSVAVMRPRTSTAPSSTTSLVGPQPAVGEHEHEHAVGLGRVGQALHLRDGQRLLGPSRAAACHLHPRQRVAPENPGFHGAGEHHAEERAGRAGGGRAEGACPQRRQPFLNVDPMQRRHPAVAEVRQDVHPEDALVLHERVRRPVAVLHGRPPPVVPLAERDPARLGFQPLAAALVRLLTPRKATASRLRANVAVR